MDNFIVIKGYIVATTTSLVGFLFGGSEAYISLLVLMVCFDIFTGVFAGAMSGKLSSKSFFGGLSKGLVRKMLMLTLLCLVGYFSKVSDMHWIKDAMIIFYIGGEGISILENLNKCGVPFPAFVINLFEQMREHGNNGDTLPKDTES